MRRRALLAGVTGALVAAGAAPALGAGRRVLHVRPGMLLVGRQHETPYAPRFGHTLRDEHCTREPVTLSLTRYERVRAALLTPHGPGPFPAVLLLHDHGAGFDIGKE